MTSPSTLQSKFLSKDNDLGIVAVGFSGGQVCMVFSGFIFIDDEVTKNDLAN